MTNEEVAVACWRFFLFAWPYAGTQHDRAELLAQKDAIEMVTGWAWCPPFRLDNPPRLALTGGTDG